MISDIDQETITEALQIAIKKDHIPVLQLFLHLFSFKMPILLGKKNVKSIVGISPTMVQLFPLKMVKDGMSSNMLYDMFAFGAHI